VSRRLGNLGYTQDDLLAKCPQSANFPLNQRLVGGPSTMPLPRQSQAGRVSAISLTLSR
jgi:hypothetical protein